MLPTEQILMWQQLFSLLSDLPADSIPDLKVNLSRAIEFFEAEILSQNIVDVGVGVGEASPSETAAPSEIAAPAETATVSDDRIEDPIAGKMRSYLTESHRLLRLLPLDVMFIAAARNPTTAQQRRQAYQDKLNLLLQYCQAVIQNSEF
jgi:hypothetical protein